MSIEAAVLSDYISTDKKYYIYGTTSLAVFFYNKIIDLCGIESVLGFLETEPTTRKYLEKTVVSPKELGELETDVRVLIASGNYFRDMKNTLLACGISEEQMIIPDKVFDYFKTMYAMKRDNIKKLCFWPPINENNPNLIKKIAWFIPDRITVSLWCENEKLRNEFGENVHFQKIEEKEQVFQEAEMIYLWDMEAQREDYEAYLSKLFVVDPDFYFSVETLNYTKLYYNSFSESEKREYARKSRQIFSELKKSAESYSIARIFCSGPSIDEIHENIYEDSINIICNSMVKDKEWLERIKPRILTFTDPNYYFSPTEYCRKFYEDVLEGSRLYDYYIIVYDYEVPLLLYHCPQLSGKVIGINRGAKTYAYPDELQLKVKNTKNILTEIMLPLASSLCDDIEMAGCTGRNPDETFYWKHNGRTQYLDLMQTIFDMYPSLFRDQNYANYYERHCRWLEELLEYGEQKGKKYRNLTTSYIPALKSRSIRE